MRDALTVGAVDRSIIILHHVKHHIVIGTVVIVAVAVPIGGADMNLDVAHPHIAIYFDFGVKEVRTSIAVEQPRVKHTHAVAIVGDHVFAAPQAVLPHIL